MRIIAGKLRGHRLKAFSAKHVRPTTDRVKESLFNKLAPMIEGSRVLDLFSGTGNLSFEAYSRGAEFVLSVEKSAKSTRIIEENKQHLKVGTGHKLVKLDVFKFLRQYQGQPFDIILIDPPFTLKLANDVMLQIVNSNVLGAESLVVIESSRHEQIEDIYSNWSLLDRKDFGDKVVSFYTHQEKE